MLNHWIKRFQYNYWANKKVLDSIVDYDINDDKIRSAVSHLFNVEMMWFERINRGKSDRDMNECRSPKACRALLWESQDCFSTMLHEMEDPDFSQKRTYTNTKGEEYSNELSDLLTHVLNHSEHHRAQIVWRMRELDFEPPVTDYIFYIREHK